MSQEQAEAKEWFHLDRPEAQQPKPPKKSSGPTGPISCSCLVLIIVLVTIAAGFVAIRAAIANFGEWRNVDSQERSWQQVEIANPLPLTQLSPPLTPANVAQLAPAHQFSLSALVPGMAASSEPAQSRELLAAHPSRLGIAFTLPGNRVGIWDVNDGGHLQLLDGHTDTITDLVFSSDGRFLASSSKDNSVLVWNLETRALAHALRSFDSGDFTTVAFSPDTSYLAAGDSKERVRLWEVSSGEQVQSWKAGPQITNLLFHPSEQVLFVGYHNRFSSWEIPSGDQLGDTRVEQIGSSQSRGMTISADGELMALNARHMRTLSPGSFRIWRQSDGVELLPQHSAYVTDIDMTVDGQILAAVDNGGEMRIWSPFSDVALHTVSTQASELTQVAFSAGNQYLMTRDSNQNIIFWRVP